MSESVLRLVIADDEGPARRFLATLLRGLPAVEIVGEATDGVEALELIVAGPGAGPRPGEGPSGWRQR
jgi:YesN/AraC family two-component response regulator